MEYFFGIDPGQSGGIACLTASGAVCWAVKMPETERDIWQQITSMGEPGNCFALIEKVGPARGRDGRKQGVTSAFTFGQGYGGLRMALVASGIPFDDAGAAKWQRSLGCLTGGDKRVSKAKAQQLFPGERVTLMTADALLIAEYCRRLRTGMLAA